MVLVDDFPTSKNSYQVSKEDMSIFNLNSHLNPLSANPTKWSNTLKQFVGKLPTNCLSVFDHFV